MTGTKYFLSYARKDAKAALKLATALRNEGVDLWLDQRDIAPGARWDRAVQEALDTCPALIAILTPSSVDSNSVNDEIGYAIDKEKKVIPILLQHCEIPFRLRRFQHIDFEADYDSGLRRLLETIRTELSPHNYELGSSEVAERPTRSATSGSQSSSADSSEVGPKVSAPVEPEVEQSDGDKLEQNDVSAEEESKPAAPDKVTTKEPGATDDAHAQPRRPSQRSSAMRRQLIRATCALALVGLVAAAYQLLSEPDKIILSEPDKIEPPPAPKTSQQTYDEIAKLIEQLNSNSRSARNSARERLTELYTEHSSAVSQALAGAISTSFDSYRVPLGVLVVLGSVPDGWIAEAELNEQVMRLQRHSSKDDPTFAEWLARAIQKQRAASEAAQ